MDPVAQRALVVGLVGAALVMARRWKNKDGAAGYGVAGWTVFILLCLLT
jgi:hypothetical protein